MNRTEQGRNARPSPYTEQNDRIRLEPETANSGRR